MARMVDWTAGLTKLVGNSNETAATAPPVMQHNEHDVSSINDNAEWSKVGRKGFGLRRAT